MSRLQMLTVARLIGEPEFKEGDKALLQKIVLNQGLWRICFIYQNWLYKSLLDLNLLICQAGEQYEDVPRGTELMLVQNYTGTFAKDLRTNDGKVYNCKNTPLDLGKYLKELNRQIETL